jgi:phytoene dehydrogenase-like protein
MVSSSESLDALVLGAGHNGLACAFYLARAGLRVRVLEKRPVVGGAAVTEEFYPGFRNSVAAYTVSLLNLKIIADMNLAGHGLRVVERKAANFLPLDDGRYLLTGEGRTAAEVAKFSQRDAERLGDYSDRLEAIAEVVRGLVLATPPNVVSGGWLAALPELLNGAGLGAQLARLDMTARRDLLALFAQSAGDFLDGWFESDPIKAVFGFDGVVGNFASPFTPGSAYVLLHHVFGEVNGKKGAWGHAIGGMGAITQAMAKACAALGVEIVTGDGVTEVLTEKHRAVGAVTESGKVHRARIVAANLHPKRLFTQLLDGAVLPADFRDRMARHRNGSGTFRMNVALSRLPDFTALPGVGDHLTAGIIIAPSLGYMDQAYVDARATGLSRAPIVEMLIPSTLDDSLAPEGRHVASLFCQHAAPALPDGRPWSERRDEAARLMIETVDARAPGFKDSVLGYRALTPEDLESEFGLIGGDIFHGKLELDQLFSARPVLGHGAYRAPVKNLYLCGAGAHPGGGVTGAPGHNAAREILKDLGKR